MPRLRQLAWQLAVCLTRVLLLMPFCWETQVLFYSGPPGSRARQIQRRPRVHRDRGPFEMGTPPRARRCMPVVLGVEQQDRDYYDLTPTTDYGDYNNTINYFFYSNTSDEELDEYLLTRDEPDEEVGVQEVTATMTTSLGGEAYRTAPSYLLLALGLSIIHIYIQLERIL